MSDTMLLGVLRMPVPKNPDPLTLMQFVDRARQAADRIESDAAELRRLHMENEDLKNACRTYNRALSREKAINAQLLEALEFMCRRCEEQGFYTPHRQPLVLEALAAASDETSR